MLEAGPLACLTAAHVLSMVFPWGMPTLGDLGQQILKTMLRRYEAPGGAVALPLSKRVAGLLSMVFCAKVTKPPGAGVQGNGNHA